ncbi:MAG: RNA polymerase sigma factor [Myxococcales bacterium]
MTQKPDLDPTKERSERERVPLVRVDTQSELSRTLLSLLPQVRRWLLRMLGPGAALDDATQETLIALAQALPNFEGRASLDTFAHRITVRVAYRYFRRGRSEVALDVETRPSGEPAPDAALSEREGLARLYRCIERLPEKRRTAFVLCAIEGLSPQEAAEVVGTSAGSMRSRLMHAREELARLLGAGATGGSR